MAGDQLSEPAEEEVGPPGSDAEHQDSIAGEDLAEQQTTIARVLSAVSWVLFVLFQVAFRLAPERGKSANDFSGGPREGLVHCHLRSE